MKVALSQEDICDGIVGSPKSCPIALRIKKKFGVNEDSVSVGRATVSYRRFGVNVTFAPLPKEARQFIADFDNGRFVQPITFRI